MYYFLMKENFDLHIYDFNININPRITKQEQHILRIFLKKVKNNSEYTEINYDTNLFKIEYPELIKLIDNIKKKSISINMFFEEKLLRTIFINFFEFLAFEDNKIIYKLSKEFLIARNYENFYRRIHLLSILYLKNMNYYNFLKIILKNLETKKEIIFEISVAEFKKTLHISESQYKRFYDLENKVIKPLLKEMDEVGFPVSFEKMKSSQGKGSKVNGIKFKTYNPFYIERNKDVSILLKEFSEYIEDFQIAHNNIFNYRKTHSLEKTREFVKKNKKVIFKDTMDFDN